MKKKKLKKLIRRLYNLTVNQQELICYLGPNEILNDLTYKQDPIYTVKTKLPTTKEYEKDYNNYVDYILNGVIPDAKQKPKASQTHESGRAQSGLRKKGRRSPKGS
jgi:hypothetical protein